MKANLVLFLGLVFALPFSNAYALDISIDSATNFNQSQRDKLMIAQQLVNQVINSAEFKDAVLNFTYKGKTVFIENNGMTNQQIYDYLMAGAEEYPVQTSTDHTMNLNLNLAHRPWIMGCGVLGFTNLDTKIISMYDCFYNKATPAEIAMNMVHEWTHKMGFDHISGNAAYTYSVPYGVGYIVRDLARKIAPKYLP